jgi:putative endonuclease
LSKANLQLGSAGEELACGFLVKNGYAIWKRNHRTKFGEIDIIAKDRDTICFVEVKTRVSQRQGPPSEAVLKFKQRNISRAAVVFLKEKKLLEHKARFDVVSVFCASGSAPRIDLIRNAFDLDPGFSL